LTALSQLYNLYFLACNDTVHVYQPSFPDQNLSNEPQLILRLPLSPHAAGGGIDPQDSHSVTRVHVDYLGCDEILLAACDDGDVIGYRVHEIQRALEAHKSSPDCGFMATDEEDRVKFFLHRNVGASAWGLAVHRNARIIAISANTHKITVLVFALSDALPPCKECLQSPPVPESMEVTAMHFEESRSSRKEDHMFALSADTNIPAVSFNNTGDDPTGHWLFSCSIDGKTMLWDLHKPGRPSAVFQIGWCASAHGPSSAPRQGHGWCACQDSGSVPHGIWGALPLDTHSAYEVSAKERDAMGVRMAEPCFEDVTEQKKWFSVEAMMPPSFEQPSDPFFPDHSNDVEVMVLDDESDASSSRSEAGAIQTEKWELDATLGLDSVPLETDSGKKTRLNELVTGAQNAGAATNTSAEHESSSTSSHSSDLMAMPESPVQAYSGQGQQHNPSGIPQLLQDMVALQESAGEIDDMGAETVLQLYPGPASNITLSDMHDQAVSCYI